MNVLNKFAVLVELEKHLGDADIIITTPFHPAYLTKERLDKAKKLKLCITAGIGSDHVDLKVLAACLPAISPCAFCIKSSTSQ